MRNDSPSFPLPFCSTSSLGIFITKVPSDCSLNEWKLEVPEMSWRGKGDVRIEREQGGRRNESDATKRSQVLIEERGRGMIQRLFKIEVRT